MSRDFAIKRGRCLTMFTTVQAALIYWANTLGGVMMILTNDPYGGTRWQRL
jgi:hypothetical protein